MDVKPAARIVNPNAMPLDAGPWATGCAVCGRFPGPLTRHHVVPKGQGGDDLPENLIWVCGDGTRGCHGVLETRNRDGETGLDFRTAGELLILYTDRFPAIRAYAEAKKWPGYLEERYLPLSDDPLARSEWLRSQGRDEEALLVLGDSHA